MRLTFIHGKFITSGKDFDTRGWDEVEPGSYATADIQVAARLKQFADERALRIFDRAFVKRYKAPALPLPSFLDSHQVEGVLWALTRSRSYLAHAPGAGKTCEAIVAAMMARGGGQIIFIVPPSLTVNWAREVAKFAYMVDGRSNVWYSVAAIPETARKDFTGWGADFLIVPDSMIAKKWVLDKLLKVKKRFVAVDEASRFMEPTAQRTIALFGGKLRSGQTSTGLVQDAGHAVLMDGSPMPSRPIQLWAPLYAMAPETIDFMSQTDFGYRYCGPTTNEWGRTEFKHSSNEAELRRRIQKDFMHVVPESALNHPERLRTMIYMTKDPRTSEMRAWEKKNIGSTTFDEIDEDMSQGDIARYRSELGMRKVPWSARYILERRESKDESTLAFCWHRPVAQELHRLLKKEKFGLVIGGVALADRQRIFDDYQDGKLKGIVGNIAAMGRGNNLQKTDRAVFVEFSWTDELNKQCEKRGSRKGRAVHKKVRCDYIVSPGSMDEPVLQAVFAGASRVKKIIG